MQYWMNNNNVILSDKKVNGNHGKKASKRKESVT